MAANTSTYWYMISIHVSINFGAFSHFKQMSLVLTLQGHSKSFPGI
jgi:hypothetical protein